MDVRSHIYESLNGTLEDELIRIRRHLHRYPELSFEEHRTAAFIREQLDAWGISYRYPVADTGILAWITGNHPGKRIALRTDMDALPITEQTGLDYSSSRPGVMHACGHDLHMASLLGTARLLDSLKEEIRGEVLFVFQPGEERVPGGAKIMLEEGLFEGRMPDMIIAQHVLPEMEAGHVGFKAGNYMASSDEIYITVKGKGGHAAQPEQINDPVLMSSHILISLQQEIPRKSPKGVPTVLSFGKVLAEGAVNVIPDRVQMEGTFRTMDESWRKEVHLLITRIASGIASSMGGVADVEIRHGYPVLRNHERLTMEARNLAVRFLGKESVEEMGIRMTAEDFAWFASTIPGMMYRLGIRPPGSEETYPLHTAGFKADESALRTGSALLTFLAVELLRNPPC
jgi:amidohydrolase